MPRPKIDPKDRKRSVRACVPCKASKVRCDSNAPCGRCSLKGRISACVYEPTNPQSRPRPSGHSHTQSLSQSTGNAEAGATTSPRSPQAAQSQSRMLLSSKGEKVYIGHSASLSYLGFIRHVVQRTMGSSAFTENEFSNFMLELEVPTESILPLSLTKVVEEKHSIIEAFAESTTGILDIIADSEFEEILSSPRFPIQNDVQFPRKTRSLNAICKFVMAIGIQVKGGNAYDPKTAASIFAEGQRFAFEGMLCDVSLDVVRMFLLMSFFMLGACQRNAAFMYIGIAAKAASALGLSNGKDEDRMLSKEECLFRQRTFKSLCILDTIVSAILGRSASCSSMQLDDLPTEPGPLVAVDSAVDAAYELCGILISLEQDLRQGDNITSSSAEAFLLSVRNCSQKLPTEMRSLSPDNTTIQNHARRKLSLGAAHFACAHYFSVILATRPFLTSHLMLKLADQGSSMLENEKPSFNADERLKIANLAQVCLDSAKFMANMLSEATAAGLLLRNMALIKAWVFGSGLLLGFALFVEENIPIDIDEAYKGVLSVLLHFSPASPQAKHYHEILTTLYDTIVQHRRKRADDKRRLTSQFLYPMFSSAADAAASNVAPTYPSPLSSAQIDAELVDGFDMDEVLSAGLDVDLSAAFAMTKDFGEDCWQPFAWGFDGT